MKPVIVIHPVTGQPCYTKHPEKLLARSRIVRRGNEYQATESFNIRIVNTKLSSVADAPRMPVTEWLHA